MSKTRLLTTLLILMALMNVALLYTFYQGKKTPEIQKFKPNGNRLVTELNFDQNQKEEFQKMFKKHRKEMRKIELKRQEISTIFFEGLSKGLASNDEGQKKYREQISKLEEQKLIEIYNHFKEVGTLCTPQQQKKYNQLIKKISRGLMHPPPRGIRRKGGQRPPRGEEMDGPPEGPMHHPPHP